MKKTNLFLSLLAAGMMFSCTNDDEVVNGPAGVKETSYIAVNVNSVYDATRANGYDDGTAEEQAVNSVHFFFFDNGGSAFNVSNDIGGTGVNYIVKNNFTDIGSEPDNVETITNAVLTIQSNKGTNPAKVVAVVNWDYADVSLALSDLKKTLVEEAKAADATKGFLMSNSVYASGATLMDATPITAAHIYSSEEAALATPVDIYVERVAVKVTVTQNDAKYDTGVANPYDGDGGQLYAEVVAWDINGTLSKSNLVKDINTAWTNNIGLTWNDEPFKRSYWAASAAVSGENTFNEEFTWNGLANTVATSDYCLENTSGENTRVLVAARIVDEDGNPVTIVKFLGEYITIDGLKNKIATALAEKYYTGGESIAPRHIEIYAAGSAEPLSYRISYRLTDDAEALAWTLKDGTTAAAVDEINADLGALESAMIWSEGMTYYFTDIKHLGAAGTDTEYGVVRNHSYQVNIEGITGLGTPVYDGDNLVDEPVTPSDTESYIAARINVLSWKLVNSDVILK